MSEQDQLGRIAAIERLQKLRESGALNDTEFEAEKQKILNLDAKPQPEAVLSPEPEPQAEPVWMPEPEQEPERKSPWKWALLLGGLALCGGLVAYGFLADVPKLRPNGAPDAEKAVEKTATETPAQAKLTIVDAFKVATGHDRAFTKQVDGNTVVIKPVRLLELPFGPVLLTSSEIKDGCHACTGAIGVHYLKRDGNVFVVQNEWPNAVEGWGWGAPPADWFLTSKYTTNPAVYARGGYTGQGYTCESATLTELRPEGPVTSGPIMIGSSNEGAVMDNGMTPGGEPAQTLEGEIANVVRNASFDVVVKGGEEPFTERYLWKSGKFVAEVAESRLGC